MYTCSGTYIHMCKGVHMYIYICMCRDTYIVRDSERQRSEGSQMVSNDIPSAAILSDHTVITDHRVMDHTDTGSVEGVGRLDMGSNSIPRYFHF